MCNKPQGVRFFFQLINGLKYLVNDIYSHTFMIVDIVTFELICFERVKRNHSYCKMTFFLLMRTICNRSGVNIRFKVRFGDRFGDR